MYAPAWRRSACKGSSEFSSFYINGHASAHSGAVATAVSSSATASAGVHTVAQSLQPTGLHHHSATHHHYRPMHQDTVTASKCCDFKGHADHLSPVRNVFHQRRLSSPYPECPLCFSCQGFACVKCKLRTRFHCESSSRAGFCAMFLRTM